MTSFHEKQILSLLLANQKIASLLSKLLWLVKAITPCYLVILSNNFACLLGGAPSLLELCTYFSLYVLLDPFFYKLQKRFI